MSAADPAPLIVLNDGAEAIGLSVPNTRCLRAAPTDLRKSVFDPAKALIPSSAPLGTGVSVSPVLSCLAADTLACGAC